MKLVVGLGNPGSRYSATRHNVGFRIASLLADRLGFAWVDSPHQGSLACGQLRDLLVLRPSTFMNASGESVGSAVAALGIVPESDLLVAFDDLDLPFGRLRLRAGGGCGGHRGMESIAESLGGDRFARLRFGIGRPPPGEDAIDYVLSPFGPDQEASLPAHLGRAVEAVLAVYESGIDSAMEHYNRAAEATDSDSSETESGL